jgi:GDP-4-dehydro-6-deoxy-D-mannose reductase
MDREGVRALVRSVRPELVYHLAAQSSVATSLKDPRGTMLGNALAQFHVLNALRFEARSARVVVAGSSDEYGSVDPADNPVSEDQPLNPATPYAHSKVLQDMMALQFATEYGLDVMRARPFMQIGPRRQDRFVGGGFARQVAEIRLGLRAPKIETGDLRLRRDFTDVRDVARAYTLIGERGQAGEVYNIASGVAHSLRDLLEALMHAAGVKAEVISTPGLVRAHEPRLLVGDSARLRIGLGWRPEISFEESAADTLTYWMERSTRALARESQS